jgi:2-keto-4-pentenoate hydratase/2-oxohepta-3-ene-1,7-dioic acid hydratase in catechol pathway
MKLLTFRDGATDAIGVRLGDSVIPLDDLDPHLPGTIPALLAEDALPAIAARLQDTNRAGISIDRIDYRPVIPRPGKIMCIGRNYAAHAAEGGAETPAFPEVFMRSATSLTAHRGTIVRPQCSITLDFEGEFAFVIGKTCRHVSEEDALDHVAGYTLFNDGSIREYQKASTQWTVGKNFDSTGAFGPELVTADELPPGLAGLTLRTRLNGEQVQEGHIDDLVFPVRKLIAILSEGITLEPGDVVVTGTPAGVGFARKPPLWMKDGDSVEVEVEGLGRLVNAVRDEAT